MSANALSTPGEASESGATFDERAAVATELNEAIQEGELDLESLTSDEQALLAEFGKMAYEESSVTTEQVPNSDPTVTSAMRELRASVGATAAAAGKCFTNRSSRSGKSLAGNTLWSMYHVGKWCTVPEGIGTKVSSSSWVEAGGQTHWAFWEYKGLLGKGAKVVSGQGRSYSQMHFKYTFTTFPQEVQPCIRLIGYPSGTSARNTTCGLN